MVEGTVVSDRNIELPHPTGVVLRMEWCTDDHAVDTWYSSADKALPELARIAADNNRLVRGLYVDLTLAGCHPSYARIMDVAERALVE